jgi:hypothetical protein
MAKPMKCKSFLPLLMNCSECENELNVPVLEMRTDFHFKTRSDFTRAAHVRPHFVLLEMRTDFHFKTRSDFTRAAHVRPHFVYRLGH